MNLIVPETCRIARIGGADAKYVVFSALKRNVVVLGGFGEGVVGIDLRRFVGAATEHLEADRLGVEEEFDLALRVFLPTATVEAVGEFDVLAFAQPVGVFARVAGEFDRNVVGEPFARLFEHDKALAEAFLAVGFGLFDEMDNAADGGFAHGSVRYW